MQKWFIYLIKCKDGSFYTGSTSDLEKRFHKHSTSSGGRYTKLHKPIEVVYKEEFLTHEEALKREKQIKGWRREKKENLIKYGVPNMPG